MKNKFEWIFVLFLILAIPWGIYCECWVFCYHFKRKIKIRLRAKRIKKIQEIKRKQYGN
jgi:hypothetical protein